MFIPPKTGDGGGGGGAHALSTHTDVVISTPADNEVLAYDTGSGDWLNQTPAEAGLAAASHAHALNDLSDVVISGPADNEVLAYDTGSGDWINQTAAEAGLAVAGHNHDGVYSLVSHNHDSAYIGIPGGSANGDILIYSGGWIRLAKDTDDKVLTLVSGLPAWATAAGGGAFGSAAGIITKNTAGDIVVLQTSGADEVPLEIQRGTDSTPAAKLIDVRNAADSASLFSIGADGAVALDGATYTNTWAVDGTLTLYGGTSNRGFLFKQSSPGYLQATDRSIWLRGAGAGAGEGGATIGMDYTGYMVVGDNAQPNFRSKSADGATKIGFEFAVKADMVTAGAKLVSFGDNSDVAYAEKFFIDKDGLFHIAGHTAGEILYHDGTTYVALTVGTNGNVLTLNAGLPVWSAPGGGSTHDLLSATHTDVVASAVSRGSLIYGNATPAWAELAVGTNLQVVATDGTDTAWTTLTEAHISDLGSYQTLDATLTALADLATSAGQLIKATGTDAFSMVTISGFGETLIDDADQGTAQATLGLVPGTNVQAYDADLTAIAGLTRVRGHLIVGGAAAWEAYAIGTVGKFLRSDGTDPSWQLLVAGDIPDLSATYSVVAHVHAAADVTSGTFADARIAQSSVTQHEAALTILETQITDGAVLARVGGTETISGTWTFSNQVTLTSGAKTSSQNAVQIDPFNTAAGNTGELRFLELAASGTNYVGMKSPDALAGNTVYTLPTAFPGSNMVLQSTSAGVLSWVAGGGGSAAWESSGGSFIADTSVIQSGDNVNIISRETDSASAVAFILDTENFITTSGSYLLKVITNSIDRFTVNRLGYGYFAGGLEVGTGDYLTLYDAKVRFVSHTNKYFQMQLYGQTSFQFEWVSATERRIEGTAGATFGLMSSEANAADAVAFELSAYSDFTTAGAKIISAGDNKVATYAEKWFLDYAGWQGIYGGFKSEVAAGSTRFDMKATTSVTTDNERWFEVGDSSTPRFGVERIDAILGSVDTVLYLGGYYLWVDTTGDLRINSSAPTSDTDGTVVGTQS